MADKPNILVVRGDDIGISSLSCYSDGLMGCRTPHIDVALAAANRTLRARRGSTHEAWNRLQVRSRQLAGQLERLSNVYGSGHAGTSTPTATPLRFAAASTPPRRGAPGPECFARPGLASDSGRTAP